MVPVDYPVFFVCVSSINVAADMVGGLREVDSGMVLQQGGPERPPVHFPLPRLAQ